MNRLAKIGLAVGGAAAAAGVLRRVLEPRYAPWEKPPYGEFPNKVLVLGGWVWRVHDRADPLQPRAES